MTRGRRVLGLTTFLLAGLVPLAPAGPGPVTSASVEQTEPGNGPAAEIVASFDGLGEVLYGPVNTGNVFRGFGDFGDLNNGDAVVRYDQLADRWLVVMPIFRRLPFEKNDPPGKGATS